MGKKSRQKAARRKLTNPCELQYSQDQYDCAQAVNLLVKIEPDAQPYKCWHNVRRKVERDGGKAVNGWSIDERTAKSVVRLVAHTIWESPSGERIDITPSDHYNRFLEEPMAGPARPIAYQLKYQTVEAAEELECLIAYEQAKIETGVWK